MAQDSYADIAKMYAERVVAGEILACKWVKAACKRQLNDLKRYKGKTSPYRFNPKLTSKSGKSYYPADNLCAFIERLPHVKGPLAGEPITSKLTSAPGNGAKIGGLKVTTESAWFAARPSGTEDVYKIYAESFKGPDHLARVQAEAKLVVDAALA